MSLNIGILSSAYKAAAPSGTLLLDDYPGAAAAYSLRKLRSAYTGPAIRVRRSLDNAQSDIGFVNNILDTTTLLTFVGGGNGAVLTWYDQSGNGNNATVVGTQPPIIVISGVLQTQNSKPCIRFRTANSEALTIAIPILADTNISIFKTAKADNLINYGPIISGSGGPPTCLYGDLTPIQSNLVYGGGLNGVNKFVTTTTNYSSANFLIYNVIVNSTNYYIYQNNNLFTQTASNAGLAAPSFNRIGAYFSFYTNGIFSELIFYKTDQTANRTGIINNTNSFYTIF
jgi:hypothetical protein